MKVAPRILCFVGLLLLPSACGSPAPAEGHVDDRDTLAKTIFARVAEAPDDVEDFIDRRAGCWHFWGEVGGDFPPREEQIRQALENLQCESLDREEARLQEKYKANAELLQLLDETSDPLWRPRSDL